jgi:hypothetical protein
MTIRILALSILSLCTLLFAGNPPSKEQPSKEQDNATTAKPRTRAHAKARITVQSSAARPYDKQQVANVKVLHPLGGH